MNKPPHDEFNNTLAFAAALMGESTPRALVVIGAARLEEEVKAITALAAPGFENDRRSHMSRVELLVSLGVFTEDVAFCFNHIARIRNHFAHVWTAVDLRDAPIADKVDALFARLEGLIGLAALSENMFGQMRAKLPRGMAPQSWIHDAFIKYQCAVLILLWHLVVVKANVAPKPIPIPLSRDGYWK
ncbi:MAG: hypothetical protein ABI222_11615 [Opitutaceae bacterium]